MSLFTDGAEEGAGAAREIGIGGVLIDHATRAGLFFSGGVPARVWQSWRTDLQEKVIFQAELAPILIAKAIWATHLRQALHGQRGREVLTPQALDEPWTFR